MSTAQKLFQAENIWVSEGPYQPSKLGFQKNSIVINSHPWSNSNLPWDKTSAPHLSRHRHNILSPHWGLIYLSKKSFVFHKFPFFPFRLHIRVEYKPQILNTPLSYFWLSILLYSRVVHVNTTLMRAQGKVFLLWHSTPHPIITAGMEPNETHWASVNLTSSKSKVKNKSEIINSKFL